MSPTGVHSLAVVLAACGISLVPLAALGQFSPGLQSLDTPTDPRSVVMGESFVAVHSLSSIMYNPAGLAGGPGASFSFSRRNLNFANSTDLFRYITFTGAIATPFADFGLFYSRFIQGELTVTTASSPEGIGTVNLADYTLGLTAARNITGGLDGGVTVKTYRFVEDVVSGRPPTHSSNAPVLVDLGLIYSYKGDLINGSGNFTISGGASLQNFGTDFKPLASASNGGASSEVIQPVPRYLRCGIAYAMNVSPMTTGGLTPFSLLVTAEYRNFLNGYDEASRKFWGFGGEVTLFEVITGRIGGLVQPFSNIYGDRGDPNIRIGLGLSLPMERFGVNTPLIFSLDYGVIPLNTELPFVSVTNSLLHDFSIGVRYINPLI